MRRDNKKGKQGLSDFSDSGIGNVIMPKGLERQNYINQCFKNNTVTILTEDQQVFNDVSINDSDLNILTFPSDVNSLGSPFFYQKLPKYRSPIIIKVLSFSTQLSSHNKENQYRIFKTSADGNKSVDLNILSEDGKMIISVDSNDSAEIDITLSNQNQDAVLNVEVSGTINLKSIQGQLFKSAKEILLQTVNEIGDENPSVIKIIEGLINFQTEKITFNEGSENGVLGNKLKSLLDDLITGISNITTTTAIGVQPIINKAEIEVLKERTSEILSELFFTD